MPGAPDELLRVAGAPTDAPSRASCPRRAQEAKAQVAEMRSLGVSRLYVADDGSDYGGAIAYAVQAATSAAAGFPGDDSVSPARTARLLRGELTARRPPRSSTDRRADPAASCSAPRRWTALAFTAALRPAVHRPTSPRPGFLPAGSDAGRRTGSYRRSRATYGHAPTPEAIFGYEAMSASCRVLKQAGTGANNRATVVQGFHDLNEPTRLFGTYSIGRQRGHEMDRSCSAAWSTAASFRSSPSRGEAGHGADRGAAAGSSSRSRHGGGGGARAAGPRPPSRPSIRGSTLTIYVSVPLNGPSRVSGEAVVNGAQLALTQVRDRIGRYHIVLRALNDATPRAAVGSRADDDRGPRGRARSDDDRLRRRAQLRRQRGLDTAAQPRGDPAGQPKQHGRRPDLDRGGRESRRTEEVLPDGRATFARVVPDDSVQAVAQGSRPARAWVALASMCSTTARSTASTWRRATS